MNPATAEPDEPQALRQANHLFLTTLTALGGLLGREFGEFADPAVREAVTTYSSRIQAFADLHRTLGADAEADLVDAGHLERLCASLCAAHLAPRGLRCEFSADAGLLPRETCRKLSLIVTELVANAAQHAFAGRSGRVSISLRRTGQGWSCQVAHNGAAFRERPRGGISLAQKLAYSLGGDLRVRWEAGGMLVTVSWPTDPASATSASRTRCHA